MAGADDLPAGWVDVQDGGTYRLQRARRRGAVRAHRRPRLAQALPLPAAAARSGARGAAPTAALEVRGAARRRRATRSSACARATCTPWPSRTASSWASATSTPTTRRAAATRSSSRSTAARPAAPASASSMDTGPRRDRRLRPGADRAARRRRPPLPRRGRQRARRRGPGRARPPRRRERRRGRRADEAAAPRARPRWAATLDTTDIRDLLYGQRRAPALGRGRRPLPDAAATARWSARRASAARSRT